jgi:hypothetical protein
MMVYLTEKTGVLLLALILTASYLSILNPAYASVENSWVSKAPMPTARGYLRVIAVNEKIYAIGGGNLGVNEEYDPATDTWTTKASMPDDQACFAIAVSQGTIYCIGGMPIGFSGASDTNRVYDPVTDSWEIKSSMPTGRYGLQANSVNGKIYCMGGQRLVGYNQGFEELSVTEIYDPASDKWSTGASMPNPASYVSAVIDNKIFVIGGSITQIYDPKTDTWSTGAPPPEAIGDAAAAATTGMMAPPRIYVYNGASLQVYDPSTDSWTFGAPPPTRRPNLGIAVMSDLLYFIGGQDQKPLTIDYYTTNEQYTPIGYGTVKPANALTGPIYAVATCTAITVVLAAGVIVYFKTHHSTKRRLQESPQ